MCTGRASARSILHVQCFRKKRGIVDVVVHDVYCANSHLNQCAHPSTLKSTVIVSCDN